MIMSPYTTYIQTVFSISSFMHSDDGWLYDIPFWLRLPPLFSDADGGRNRLATRDGQGAGEL